MLYAVVTIAALSLLLAQIVNMQGDTALSHVAVVRGEQALYLAEAGINVFVAQSLRSINQDSLQQTIMGMHHKTFTLSGNEKFHLRIAPYWFQAASVSGTQVTVNEDAMPAPPLMPGMGGHIRLGEEAAFAKVTHSDSGSLGLADVVGTLVSTTPTVYFAALTTEQSSINTATRASTLTLPEDQAEYFPEFNGIFSLYKAGDTTLNGGTFYAYRQREGTLLRDVGSVTRGANVNITVPMGTYVTLEPFVRIISTGIHLDASHRTLVAHMPLGVAIYTREGLTSKEVLLLPTSPLILEQGR